MPATTKTKTQFQGPSSCLEGLAGVACDTGTVRSVAIYRDRKAGNYPVGSHVHTQELAHTPESVSGGEMGQQRHIQEDHNDESWRKRRLDHLIPK